jgi:hypothetical protein
MDAIQIVSTFNHLLNIKDKLFPSKTDSVSTEATTSDLDRYCSLYLESSFCSDTRFDEITDHLELSLAKKSSFTVPILRIDWCMMENKLDSIRPIDFNMPKPWLVDENGFVMRLHVPDIMSSHIDYLGLKGRKLSAALSDLCIQCTYADGYRQYVNAADSLKQLLHSIHSKRT